MWLIYILWCRLTITHFSISSSSSSSIFILFLRFTPPYLIWFLSFLILLDVWLGFSFHTLLLLIQYVHSFIITFSVGILRFATHDGFLTHCISCMRGMGIISLGLLSLVSVHFFHPITLAYITSHVLRPPWDHDFTHYVWKLTHGQYSRLVGDYFLEHDGWGVEVIDYTRAYPSYQ